MGWAPDLLFKKLFKIFKFDVLMQNSTYALFGIKEYICGFPLFGHILFFIIIFYLLRNLGPPEIRGGGGGACDAGLSPWLSR